MSCSVPEFVPLPEGAFCPDCAYDLRGSTSVQCPECGFSLHALQSQISLIPWSHRRQRGRLRAYWQTVWLVVRWPRRFCLEMVRPVSFRAARSFRWVTTLHAYVPIALGSLAWAWFDHVNRLRGGEKMWWMLGCLQAVALALLVVLPAIAGGLFRSRRLTPEQRCRAVALSYYAWAPLAVMPVALPFWVLTLLHASTPNIFFVAGPATAATLAVYTVCLAERRVFRVAQYTLCGGRLITIARVLGVNALALLLASFALLLPLSFFYVLVVIYSVARG